MSAVKWTMHIYTSYFLHKNITAIPELVEDLLFGKKKCRNILGLVTFQNIFVVVLYGLLRG